VKTGRTASIRFQPEPLNRGNQWRAIGFFDYSTGKVHRFRVSPDSDEKPAGAKKEKKTKKKRAPRQLVAA